MSRTAASWARDARRLRRPEQVVGQWPSPVPLDRRLLDFRVRGRFWETLAETGQTLLVTREYEHLVLALSTDRRGAPRTTHMVLPHPSGVAVANDGRVFIACTRNPNMVVELAPCAGSLRRGSREPRWSVDALLPTMARYYPGGLYLHDLAWIGGRLYGNAVALNAVVELPPAGGFVPAWWPRCVDSPRGPRFDRNYLQLNSIAGGTDLAGSFFSASTAKPGSRRPGHLAFPVDRRGVIFSGRTREVVATGLTRPHSARTWNGDLWVDNSGYGELVRVVEGRGEPWARLPGWTRGLSFHGSVAFVGTSRVIPRFRHYAPGVEPARATAGVHAVSLESGAILGSIVWPAGYQVFAVELLGAGRTNGLPFRGVGSSGEAAARRAFLNGLALPPVGVFAAAASTPAAPRRSSNRRPLPRRGRPGA